MIQVVALLIVLVFTLAVVFLAAAPMYEKITDVVTTDDAVQSLGHADEVTAIQDTVLEQLWPVVILLFVAYGFVYILRQEKFEGRLGP